MFAWSVDIFPCVKAGGFTYPRNVSWLTMLHVWHSLVDGCSAEGCLMLEWTMGMFPCVARLQDV